MLKETNYRSLEGQNDSTGEGSEEGHQAALLFILENALYQLYADRFAGNCYCGIILQNYS